MGGIESQLAPPGGESPVGFAGLCWASVSAHGKTIGIQAGGLALRAAVDAARRFSQWNFLRGSLWPTIA